MNYARISCVSLALAVLLGSVGAHAIKPYLSVEAFNSWETAVKYQYYHSFGLLVLALAPRVKPMQAVFHRIAMHSLALGVLFFCGSFYLRSSSPLTGVDFSWLGPVAPMGGLLFVAGWLLAALSFGKRPAKAEE